MASIVTEQAYRLMTGDLVTPTDEVLTQLEIAQAMVEERLGRALAHGSYTETLLVGTDASLRPSVTPLDPSTPGYINSAMLTILGQPVHWTYYGYTVTYTGGWTSDTLPKTIARAISLLTQANLDPADPLTGKPVATRIGDLSMSIADAKLETSPIWPKGAWALIRNYRRADKVLS